MIAALLELRGLAHEQHRTSQFHPVDVWRPTLNPRRIAGTVTLSTFMEVLDTSIANVALPHIAGSLSAAVDESTWVLSSYLVSNAIVLPLTGWFSRLLDRPRIRFRPWAQTAPRRRA